MIKDLRELVQEYGPACSDLDLWWKSGVLPDGPLRERANDPEAPWAEISPGDPRQAEHELLRNIVQAIAEIHQHESAS